MKLCVKVCWFYKQKTTYELRIRDWRSDVCSSDLTCRSNQPCPDAPAQAARDALVEIVGKPTGTSRDGHVFVSGPTLSCLSEGSAGGTRTAAWCTSDRKSTRLNSSH